MPRKRSLVDVPRQRKDGRWEIRITYTTPAGETKRFSSTAATDVECIEKAKQVRERLADEKPVTDSRMMLAAWSRQWREKVLPASERRESTKDSHAYFARVHIEGRDLGKLPMTAIRYSDITDWQTELKKAELADSTRANALLTLRAVFDDAIREELIVKNQARSVKLPAIEDREEARVLAPEEFAQFLPHITPDRSRDLIELIRLTCVRPGEGLGFEWPNVDFSKHVLRVRTTLYYKNAKDAHLGPVKTKAGRRDIPMTPEIEEILKRQRKRQAAEQLRWGDSWGTPESKHAVWTTARGTFISRRNLYWDLKEGIRKSGFSDEWSQGVGLHTLRHTGATDLLDEGVPMHVVSRILGHAKFEHTVNMYGHPREVAFAEAMEALSKRARGATGDAADGAEGDLASGFGVNPS